MPSKQISRLSAEAGKLTNMSKPKLIFLNGFAASGKSTLTEKYLNDHKFALGLEGDVLIAMLGGWKEDWDGAHQIRLKMSEILVKGHLSLGYDVVLPFLLHDAAQAEQYEKIAQEVGADFNEVYLELEKDEAVERLLKRGTWGEEGLPPLTEDDRPEIEKMYDSMYSATKQRPNMISVKPHFGAIEETYQELLAKLAGE